jgi:peptide/nickel transport system permease protein/glutathione transport system permease protein
MRQFVLRRLLQAPLSLLLVSVIVFVILNVTGDPVSVYLGTEATPERVAELRAQLGLDRSLPVQYARFLGGALRGDFGRSLRYDRPALAVVLDNLGPTVTLGCVGVVLALIVGLGLGTLAAVRSRTWIDRVTGGLSVLGLSVPGFWLGIMLIVLFAVRLRWLPTSGMEGARYYVLPAVTLATYFAPQFALLVRTSLLEVLREVYVTTARSKGLSEGRILSRHVFNNALPPIIAFVGLQVGTLLGGAVVTETVFAWPGLGRLTIDAISQRDIPVVEAAVFVLALGIVLSNFAADLANAVVDPRIRYD